MSCPPSLPTKVKQAGEEITEDDMEILPIHLSTEVLSKTQVIIWDVKSLEAMLGQTDTVTKRDIKMTDNITGALKLVSTEQGDVKLTASLTKPDSEQLVIVKYRGTCQFQGMEEIPLIAGKSQYKLEEPMNTYPFCSLASLNSATVGPDGVRMQLILYITTAINSTIDLTPPAEEVAAPMEVSERDSPNTTESTRRESTSSPPKKKLRRQ